MTNSQFFELATSNGLNVVSASHRSRDKEGKVRNFKVMFAYGFESIKDANEFADIYGLKTTTCARCFSPSFQRGWDTYSPGSDCMDIREFFDSDILDWEGLDFSFSEYLKNLSIQNIEDVNLDELAKMAGSYKYLRNVLLSKDVTPNQFLYCENILHRLRENKNTPLRVYEHGLPHYVFDNKECAFGVFNESEKILIG